MNKPTEKQENTVRFICKRLNIMPPTEHSKQSYWKFINENLLNAQYRIRNDDDAENYDDDAEHMFMETCGYW